MDALAPGGGGGTGADFSKLEERKGISAHRMEPVKAVLSDQDILTLGEKFRKTVSPVERRLAFSLLLEGLTADNALLMREQIAHLDDHSSEFREFHYAWGAVAGADAVLLGADTPGDDMSPALAGWASADPGSALDWFNGLDMENDAAFDNLLKERKIPVNGLTNHIMRGLVSGLAASQYLDTLPESAARDAAVSGFSRRLARENPEAALTWANSISSEDERMQAVVGAGQVWARRDAKAAAEWAANSGLPERAQQAILNPPRSRRD